MGGTISFDSEEGVGCDIYIRKPVNFVQFNEAVRQLGLYWLVLNVPRQAGGA